MPGGADSFENTGDAKDQPVEHRERNQCILSLDHALWREMIEVFDLTECLIPDRSAEEAAATQVAANGWYA